ncbi:MAG: PE-PPE domain-containing protein [Mycobacterium sp.]
MNRHRYRTVAATLAALSMPAAFTLTPTPSAAAATVLAAEGTWRQSGEAQTAFNGAFCELNTCRSIGPGPISSETSSQQIQTAVDGTQGDIIVMGYSLGAAGVYDGMRKWESNPDLAPAPERVVLIVTYGNPENKFGGNDRTDPGAGLPAVQPYQHLDVVAQYDTVADTPTRFNFYSLLNIGFSRHFAYFEDMDVNDPDNLIYQEGNTTYMLIEADTLPMLRWVEPFVSDQRMAELDARYRPLVESGYDRPDYIRQGEGADWGNGTPPPSVSGSSEEVARLTEESETTTAPVIEEPTATARTANSVRSEEDSSDSAAERGEELPDAPARDADDDAADLVDLDAADLVDLDAAEETDDSEDAAETADAEDTAHTETNRDTETAATSDDNDKSDDNSNDSAGGASADAA